MQGAFLKGQYFLENMPWTYLLLSTRIGDLIKKDYLLTSSKGKHQYPSLHHTGLHELLKFIDRRYKKCRGMIVEDKEKNPTSNINLPNAKMESFHSSSR